MTRILTWHGCYDGDMREYITPESFSHPAKMSRRLCERILDYGLERGYWKPGDLILDPFGGIGTTGIIGAYRGYRVVMVELEERFVNLAQENIALNKPRLDWINAPLPVMIQGDSRKLVELLAGADGVLTSPPYAQSLNDGHTSKRTDGTEFGYNDGNKVNVGNLPEGDHAQVIGAVTSPPYADGCRHTGGDTSMEELDGGHYIGVGIDGGICSPPYAEARIGQSSGAAQVGHGENYGASDGQLANLPEGDINGVITSPPYEDSVNAGEGGIDWDKAGRPERKTKSKTRHGVQGSNHVFNYQDLRGSITSPPYESSNPAQSHMVSKNRADPSDPNYRPSWKKKIESGYFGTDRPYGDGADQIGTLSGDTYWSAVCLIYSQVYQLLLPGGALAVVVKDYVRDWKRVPLCDQTAELLRSIGFDIPERVHAMLVKEVPIAIDMFVDDENGDIRVNSNFKNNNGLLKFFAKLLKPFGIDLLDAINQVYKYISHKSFFRRLAENKGAPAIDYEEVIWAVKPK